MHNIEAHQQGNPNNSSAAKQRKNENHRLHNLDAPRLVSSMSLHTSITTLINDTPVWRLQQRCRSAKDPTPSFSARNSISSYVIPRCPALRSVYLLHFSLMTLHSLGVFRCFFGAQGTYDPHQQTAAIVHSCRMQLHQKSQVGSPAPFFFLFFCSWQRRGQGIRASTMIKIKIDEKKKKINVRYHSMQCV